MISQAARITTAALRARWSTVAILAGILSIGRAIEEWPLTQTDPSAYVARLLVTILISIIISLIIHVVLYLLFSPKDTTALARDLTSEKGVKRGFPKGKASAKKK